MPPNSCSKERPRNRATPLNKLKGTGGRAGVAVRAAVVGVVLQNWLQHLFLRGEVQHIEFDKFYNVELNKWLPNQHQEIL